MSDPTYRIDVEHRPQEQGALKWIARVFRLSNEQWIGARWAETSDKALQAGQEFVADANRQQPGFSQLVDDDGRPIEGHSVKA